MCTNIPRNTAQWKFRRFLITINLTIRNQLCPHRLPRLSSPSLRQRDFVRELRSSDEGGENELHRKNVGTSISEFESVVLSGRGNSDRLFCLPIIRLPFRQIINTRHLLEFADKTFD